MSKIFQRSGLSYPVELSFARVGKHETYPWVKPFKSEFLRVIGVVSTNLAPMWGPIVCAALSRMRLTGHLPCKRSFFYALAPASRRSISSIAGFIPESAAEIRASAGHLQTAQLGSPAQPHPGQCSASSTALGRQQQNLC